MCESAASVVSVRSRRSANRSRPELKSVWGAGRTGWLPRKVHGELFVTTPMNSPAAAAVRA